MRWLVVLTIVLTPGAAVAQGTSQAAAQCERLASLSLPNTTITAAQVVNAGAFVVPGSAPREGGGSSALAGTIGPVPDVPGRVTANTAGLGLGYNGGRGIPPFSTLPAFCRVAATLEAIALFGHPHGDVAADRRVERQLPRHQSQRPWRSPQLQRDGRRRD